MRRPRRSFRRNLTAVEHDCSGRYPGSGRTAPMDFADSPEHAAFRREFRDWLDANLADELKVEDAQDQRISPDRNILQKRIAWQKKMHDAGWVGISWPTEYGGRGANFMQQVIWD